MKKLPDLKELPENMLEIKEDRSEISLQDLIDNFYTQPLQDSGSERRALNQVAAKRVVEADSQPVQQIPDGLDNEFKDRRIQNQYYGLRLIPNNSK